MNKHQIILAIEGIDGAGKTTLINEICNCFGEEIRVYKRTRKGKLMDKLLSSAIMRKYYMLQIPIYLIISYKNYILFKISNSHRNKIIIMDRCFLSNICYFFPKALKNNKLLKKILLFEVKLFPKKIFILDVEPKTGQIRDLNRKSLKWLKFTRNAYLEAIHSNITNWVNIELIQKDLPIENKCKIIINYIIGEKYGD